MWLWIGSYLLVAVFTLASFIYADSESVALVPVKACCIAFLWPLFWLGAAFFLIAAVLGFAVKGAVQRYNAWRERQS